jgi:hypothetical protein
MAQGISSALDDYLSADGSTTAAGAATMWTPRRATVRAPAAGRPRWERRYAVDANAQGPERHVASLGTTLDRFGFDTIIGRSPKFVAAIDAAQKVAATATTVLLTGESEHREGSPGPADPSRQRARRRPLRRAQLRGAAGLTRFQLYVRLKRYHIEVDRRLGVEQV